MSNTLSLGDWFGFFAGLALFFFSLAQIKVSRTVAIVGASVSLGIIFVILAVNDMGQGADEAAPISIPMRPSENPPVKIAESRPDVVKSPSNSRLTDDLKSRPPEWWVASTPVIGNETPTSDEGLWEWASKYPGACEPLRQYLIRFPAGVHSRAANEMLSSERHMQRQMPIIDEKRLPTIGRLDRSVMLTMTPAMACLSVGKDAAQALSKRCYGAALAPYVQSVRGVVIGAEGKVLEGSCECSRQMFSSYYDCRYAVETTCRVRSIRMADAEICPGSNKVPLP